MKDEDFSYREQVVFLFGIYEKEFDYLLEYKLKGKNISRRFKNERMK